MQTSPPFLNPYYANDAVRDLDMFFGRQRELQILYQALAKHQSVSIVGIRHIGKSSLLRFLGEPELQRRYGFDLSQHIFILTDWREYLQKTRADFFHAVCHQVVTQSRHRVTLSSSTLSGEAGFRKLLEDIKQSGFHPVLLMDAFDRVTINPEFDPHFFSFLRSLAGINDLISYITATIKPLYKVCHSDAVAQSPFFNIFLTCPLGPLAPAEARELIVAPARQTAHAFSPAEVDWLLKQAGSHPFFLQVACRHLLEAKHQQADEHVDVEQVQQAIDRELRPHFQRTWEDFDTEEQKQLMLDIFQYGPAKHQYPELSKSVLFSRKVREISPARPIELELEDIKSALEHLDDVDFLASSKLCLLQCISLQIENSTSLPASKRGVLVRELLKKAFEQMKPEGMRSDTAQEWRFYNILWYHYFKYSLPNHHTAARLGVSARQFYREQERALQALHKQVLALEETALRLGE